MIRKHPRLDLENPPGQWVNPLFQQGKSIVQEIEEYKSTEAYRKGFNDGWNKAMNAKFPQPTSEAGR